MILADTSVWVSFLRKDDKDLSVLLKKYLETNEIFTVSAVFGELFQGVKNKREFEVLSLLWSGLPKVDEQNLFIHAGQISNKHRLYAKGIGLIDCYLIAACMSEGLRLWTLDKKLQKAFATIVQ